MQYRINPQNGEKLSVLGFGCMRFTKRAGAIDQEKAEKELSLALELGVNYFDTAYVYPGSEVCLGKFIKASGCRDRIRIATKLPHYQVKKTGDIERIFNEELARLQTEHIDYYMMHMLNDVKSWERLCGLGILDWIGEKKRSGAIRNIGFSFHGGTSQFKELLDCFPWDFCQLQFNYMDEHAQAGIEGLDHAYSKGIPVIIMEPLRGGRLVNGLPPEALAEFENMPVKRSPADWGLRWIWNHPQATVVLSGMNDEEQIRENCRVASESLPDSLTAEEKALYGRVLKAINKKIRIGCTGCGYCQPCPHGVDIPTCFTSYNMSYSDSYIYALREYFMCTALRNERSGAGLCTGCGKCEQICPQHIGIRKELRKVKKRLETPVYRIAAAFSRRIMRY